MEVGIIDYGMGNIKSILNALKQINIIANLINDKNKLEHLDVIILPGVGAFEKAMNALEQYNLITSIKKHVKSNKKLIGICLGMQLLFEESHEFGLHKGLELIKGTVLPFKDSLKLRVPHVGWNYTLTSNPEYSNFNDDYYFVHSFYCNPSNESDILFKTKYGEEFCSGVKNNNIYGLQFHPEKSQISGLNLLKKIINE